MNSVKRFGKELANHFMTGVSYMLPVVVAGGLMASFAVIFGGPDVWSDTTTIWGELRQLGVIGLNLVVPIVAAYISYSIADKPGLGPAFIGGMAAQQINTGFLGGMVVGVATGYFVQLLKKIKLPPRVAPVKTMIIIPLVASTVIGFLTIYVIGSPIAAMNTALTNWLQGMSEGNAILLSIILGAMMAVDMGGPINKIANTFGLAAFAEGIYVISTPMEIAVSIAPVGMFLATIIGKKYYSEEEIESGRSAIIMGLVGISEGAIPFAVTDPLCVIPSIIVGSTVSSGMVTLLGVTQNTALSTFLAIPFASNIFLYLLCIAAGIIVTAVMVNGLKSIKYRKKKLPSEELINEN
ncbi:PTS fructose transporter subunit IIC [Carnobacterium sp.]|uniref:PTS fructose transporter subunit IIC n=1 Tax=Carnobacterium sp. TaxID=48221 RepID=UPI0028AE4967|nr:PTS fructose transporter subunit IIC [Carnobacterium sp.]